jgi:hypothetical protein
LYFLVRWEKLSSFVFSCWVFAMAKKQMCLMCGGFPNCPAGQKRVGKTIFYCSKFHSELIFFLIFLSIFKSIYYCSMVFLRLAYNGLNMVRLAFQYSKLSIYYYVYLYLSSSFLALSAKCTIFFVVCCLIYFQR